MGYKSPIQLIFGSIRRQMEDGIFKAVQECDIRVDRDELIRALQYDRAQYEKGYADGIAAAEKARPVVRGEWIEKPHTDGFGGHYFLYHCSRCDTPYAKKRNFCNECGADLRGE